MEAICVNNENWFGTLGKSYEVLDIVLKQIKDIRYTGDTITFEALKVIDDCDQEVTVPSSWFYPNEVTQF